MGSAEKTNKYAHLEQFSTQQLEDILRADLELQEGGDPDMVLYILDVIEKRENGKSLENRADAERAFKEFHELYHTSEGTGESLYPADTNEIKNSNFPNHIDRDSSLAYNKVIFSEGHRIQYDGKSKQEI